MPIPEAVQAELDILRAKHQSSPLDIERYLANWEQLVEEIGQYPGSLADEYLNDLGARDLIHNALCLAHDDELTELLNWALPLVERLDQRFLSKSIADDECLVWGNYLDPSRWWLRQLPDDAGLLKSFRGVGAEMRSHSYRR